MVQKISNEVTNVRAQYSESLEIQYSISEKIIFEMLEISFDLPTRYDNTYLLVLYQWTWIFMETYVELELAKEKLFQVGLLYP